MNAVLLLNAMPLFASMPAVQAVPTMPNIEYVAQGYNIYYGNPHATSVLGTDPGFNNPPGMGQKIFETKYSGQTTGDRRYALPDGFEAEPDVGCELDFVSTSSYRFTNYTGTLHTITHTGGGFLFGSFTCSTDYKLFLQRITHEHKRAVSSTAECTAYSVTVEEYTKPPLERNFANCTEQLPEEYGDGEKFFDMFDGFGTHSLASAKMGARYGFNSYFTEEDWTNVERTGKSVLQSASMNALFASGAEKTMNQKEIDMAATFRRSALDLEYISLGAKPVTGDAAVWQAQVFNKPMPIRYGLRSICDAIPNAKKKANCVKALSAEEYCTKRIKKRGDIRVCANANDFQCSWDMDCAAGYSCINYKCQTGGFPIALRQNPKLCLELNPLYLEPVYHRFYRLILNTCNGGQGQKWFFNSGNYENYMQIQFAANPNFCIDASTMVNGSPLVAIHCNGGPSQTWAREVASGLVYIPSNNMAMDAGSGITAGKTMMVWQQNALTQQQFDILGPASEELLIMV